MTDQKPPTEIVKPTPKHLRKFWGNVAMGGADSCWEWIGSKFENGYGRIYVCGKTRKAHRFSYFIARGVMPPPLEYVCHHCDNPACVNPSHLFLGDAQANASDMVRKNRQAKGDTHMSKTHPEKIRRGKDHRWTNSGHSVGEKNCSAKLNESKVRLIRSLYGEGGVVKITELAKDFNVSFSLISQIIRREAWSHVK